MWDLFKLTLNWGLKEKRGKSQKTKQKETEKKPPAKQTDKQIKKYK